MSRYREKGRMHVQRLRGAKKTPLEGIFRGEILEGFREEILEGLLGEIRETFSQGTKGSTTIKYLCSFGHCPFGGGGGGI